jgi:hypothetical protein
MEPDLQMQFESVHVHDIRGGPSIYSLVFSWIPIFFLKKNLIHVMYF